MFLRLKISEDNFASLCFIVWSFAELFCAFSLCAFNFLFQVLMHCLFTICILGTPHRN